MRSLVEPPRTQNKIGERPVLFLGLDRQVLSHRTSCLFLWRLAAHSGPYGHQSGVLSYTPNGSTGLPPLQPRIPSAQSESRGIRLKAGGGSRIPQHHLEGVHWGPLRADPHTRALRHMCGGRLTRRWESRLELSCHWWEYVYTRPTLEYRCHPPVRV